MNSGMVRKIDELGRIVIPKEIRKNLKLNMGDNVEIFVDENKIVLKKFSTMLGLEEDLFNIAKVINENTNSSVLFTDTNDIIVSYGKKSELYLDSQLNVNIFLKITDNTLHKCKDTFIVNEFKEERNTYIFTLLSKNIIMGLMIVIENEHLLSTNDIEMIKSFKKFINKQLEK